MNSIGILGAGTWGIALAALLTRKGHRVTVWSALEKEIEVLSDSRLHQNLPGLIIPEEIIFTKDIAAAINGMDVVVFAVPSNFIRGTARKAAPYIQDSQIVVDVAKGIEADTLYTMTQVIAEELSNDAIHCVALSGPTHAEEVALGLPTTIVSACKDTKVASIVQEIFSTDYMRVYTNDDVRGVELCGAVKNIVALAAGISAGLGYGDNAKAALITRGVAEITRLGIKMGCKAQTFNGLAGIGDMIVTATSMHSRNNRCGILIGQGIPANEAMKQIGMVVEGVNALPAAIQLATFYQVDMPIVAAVNAIVNEGANPEAVVKMLMCREKKPETTVSSLNSLTETSQEYEKRSHTMKRVITYGTFDLLHYGHLNLLRRAKALGDYLVVAISTDEFNWNEKQKKCYFSYEQRKEMLEALRYVDLVIPEDNWEQKRTDVHEYHIDTFVMGDDWKGKFDFLEEEGVEVVYLPRTPEISTTQIKRDLHK